MPHRRAAFAALCSRAAAAAPSQGRRWGKEMAWERRWEKDRSDRRERERGLCGAAAFAKIKIRKS